jgi:hypothetical protein
VTATQAQDDADSAQATADAVAATVAGMTHFHSTVQTVTVADTAQDFTFAELDGAKHYVVSINRMMLRADEYSVSGTTVSVVANVLAEDDEIEVTGLSL